MTGFLRKNPRSGFNAAAFDVDGTEIQAADAGEGYSLRAHRTGLQRYVKIAGSQPLAIQNFGSRAYRQNFGMGGGIFHLDDPVRGAGNDTTRCRF